MAHTSLEYEVLSYTYFADASNPVPISSVVKPVVGAFTKSDPALPHKSSNLIAAGSDSVWIGSVRSG
jgi:hypothetical protein